MADVLFWLFWLVVVFLCSAIANAIIKYINARTEYWREKARMLRKGD